MEHGLLAKSPRIEVVDALRGFAVMAIMLLHNIEHFNCLILPPVFLFQALADRKSTRLNSSHSV